MAVTDDAAEVLAYYPRLRPRLQIVLSCEKVVEKRLFVKVGMALSLVLVKVNRIGRYIVLRDIGNTMGICDSARNL
jgi:hypothetical protein